VDRDGSIGMSMRMSMSMSKSKSKGKSKSKSICSKATAVAAAAAIPESHEVFSTTMVSVSRNTHNTECGDSVELSHVHKNVKVCHIQI
jgi:hypothetical protein